VDHEHQGNTGSVDSSVDQGSPGGERRIDIARARGYGDGSAITQILKRLRNRVEANPAISRRLSRIEVEFNRVP